MILKANHILNGTIIATSWDKFNHVKKFELYTEKGEDILIEHKKGLKMLLLLTNHKVRLKGDLIIDEEGKKFLIKRITRLEDDTSPSAYNDYDEYHLSDEITFLN